MLEGITSFIDQVLMFGYEKLSPVRQAEIKFNLPAVYVGLKTHGKRIAESTTTEFDDLTVGETIEFCENLAEKENIQSVLQMKGIQF